MPLDCKYDNIVTNLPNICTYLDDCDYSYFNFLKLHYCYLDSNIWLTLPLISFFGLICFYLLSDTSNKYLSNSLTILSHRLGFSQSLTGLTFLALANGAPDVVSSIVASEDKEGLDFTIGALMGSGLFVSCIVLS
jgi:sodium/potassium/calcium exchanger 6